VISRGACDACIDAGTKLVRVSYQRKNLVGNGNFNCAKGCKNKAGMKFELPDIYLDRLTEANHGYYN